MMSKAMMKMMYNFDKIVWGRDGKSYVGYSYGAGTVVRAYVYTKGRATKVVYTQMGY